MGSISAFIFFLSLLAGFIYGVRPIPGAERYSDGHFHNSIVPIKANVLYKFSCDFNGQFIILNNRYYRFNLTKEFSFMTDTDSEFSFGHADKQWKIFDFFWSKDFIVYNNLLADNVYLVMNGKKFGFTKEVFESGVKQGLIKLDTLEGN